jgi:uncharacterized repeat protein (TIGR01451 family)
MKHLLVRFNSISWLLGVVVLAAPVQESYALGSYGTQIDTYCTNNNRTPAKPYNGNCALCHPSSGPPPANATQQAGWDNFAATRTSGNFSVFCPTVANQAPNGTITSPTANVTITAGQTVSFAGSGTDPDNNTPLTYSWTFPGGTPASSTAQNPGNVTFANTGTTPVTATVTFTVTDSKGLRDPTPATRTITVNAANQAPSCTISSPTANQTITSGQSVSFAGTGSDPDGNTPLTYSWTFPAGTPGSSTAQNPGNVTFANSGTTPVTGTVTFTVTDSRGLRCANPATRTITVNPAPVANQAPSCTITSPTANQTITAGQSVSFAGAGSDPDNNTPLTYSWDFGGGAANSTAQNPGAVAFGAAGTYTVIFTATDSKGLRCSTPAIRTVTVNAANQAPSCTISSPTANQTITAGQPVSFAGAGSDPDNNTPLTYGWTFPGGTPASSTAQNPGNVIFANTGTTPVTSTVSFTVTDGKGLSCAAAATRAITVNPANRAPSCTITSPTGNVTVQAGQSVNFAGTGADPENNLPLSFDWDFGGGAPYSAAAAPGNVNFAVPGSFTVTFTVIDGKGLGCATPATRTVTVQQNPISGGDCLGPLFGGADLSVTSTGAPNPVLVGQNLTYTVRITNGGPQAATGVTLRETLPAGVTPVSAVSTPGTCTVAVPQVSCAIGNLANGATATATLVVTPLAAASLSNTFSVAAKETDPNPGNNAATTVTTVSSSIRTFRLSVLVSGSGRVVSDPIGISCPGTCARSYPAGTAVTLTATPSSGSSFRGWSSACSGTGPCTVQMSSRRSVRATFTGGGRDRPARAGSGRAED